MKNFLKLSLLVTLLTGAVEMRSHEELSPVGGPHVKPSEAPVSVVQESKQVEPSQAAIDEQATAAGKIANHNAAMIKTIKLVIPISGGLGFGKDIAAKPDVASAPVSDKGGISLGRGTGSKVETHTADDGSKVIIHTDADGAIQKAVITHKAPAYSFRSITDSIGFTLPKQTVIEHNVDDEDIATHKATTVDLGYFGKKTLSGLTKTEVTYDAKDSKITSMDITQNPLEAPSLGGLKTYTSKTSIDYKDDGPSQEVTKKTVKAHPIIGGSKGGSPRTVSSVSKETVTAVNSDGSRTLLTTSKDSSSLSSFSGGTNRNIEKTNHETGVVQKTVLFNDEVTSSKTVNANGKVVQAS